MHNFLAAACALHTDFSTEDSSRPNDGNSSHVYYEHLPEVWVPRMALDVEDAKTVSEIRPVVNDFVYESAAKFVTGRLDISDDNDWNTYLAELDKIGLPQYLEIMNATYESYK